MEERETHNANFGRAHEAFESMNMRDRSVFLVEATASTLIRGIQKASETLADELENAFGRAESAADGETGEASDTGPSSGGADPSDDASTNTSRP